MICDIIIVSVYCTVKTFNRKMLTPTKFRIIIWGEGGWVGEGGDAVRHHPKIPKQN